MTKSIPLPYDYLIPGYGLTHPLIDGLLIARDLIENHRAVHMSHSDKEQLLRALDQCVEQVKVHTNLYKS